LEDERESEGARERKDESIGIDQSLKASRRTENPSKK
jgi:hypothetical protein